VVHSTEYDYSAPMTDGYTVAHLLPRETPLQRVESAAIETEPAVDEEDTQVDVFGNTVVRIGVHHPHDRFVVTSRSIVEALPPAGWDTMQTSTETWEDAAAAVLELRGDGALEVGPFAAATPRTPSLDAVREFTAEMFTPGRRLVDAVDELCTRIYRDFEFDSGFSDISTPVDAVIAARRGVCQDFAHLAIAICRHEGVAARYVSGWLFRPDGREPGESHAWMEAHVPGDGWVELDATHPEAPRDHDIRVATGRDYADVAPLRGSYVGAPTERMTVSVEVEELAAAV
jgi:transglutaminase-like putative cysteine protease